MFISIAYAFVCPKPLATIDKQLLLSTKVSIDNHSKVTIGGLDHSLSYTSDIVSVIIHSYIVKYLITLEIIVILSISK